AGEREQQPAHGYKREHEREDRYTKTSRLGSAFKRRLALKRRALVKPPRGEHRDDEQRAQAEGGQAVAGARRKDQDEALALDERREARHAKGDEKQAQLLPSIEGDRPAAGLDGVYVQRKADDAGEPYGGQPQRRAGIEIADEHDEVPDQVAPQDEPSRRDV